MVAIALSKNDIAAFFFSDPGLLAKRLSIPLTKPGMNAIARNS